MSDDGTYIDFLRVRLPYSFERIEPRRGRGFFIWRRPSASGYVLSVPKLHEGTFSATHHNFWKRGHAFYIAGKLLDCHWLSSVLQSYRREVGLRLIEATNGTHVMLFDSRSFYNSMQLQKLWDFTHDNVLDRERAMMANTMLSLELCLKAVMAHANHRETGSFSFSTGHDVARLYEALPGELQDEIAGESEVFARDYLAFRSQVEDDINGMRDKFPQGLEGVRPSQQLVADWEEIAARMNSIDYSAFVDTTDPGNELHEGWFQDALRKTKRARGFRDPLQYYRYAPAKGLDELPIEALHWGLLLGRFFFEHLFPLPPNPDRPVTTQLLA